MKIKAISPWRAFRSSQMKRESKRLIKLDLVKQILKKIKDPLALYQAQMIEQGLISKDYIETSYDKFQLEYQDVWQELSFDQKSKFINREMKDLFASLRYVTLETETRIYLPFFNERFNRFYRDSIAVMDFQHFRQQFKDFYKHCVKPISFGSIIFTGSFSQAKLFHKIDRHHFFLLDTINHLIIEIQLNKKIQYYTIKNKSYIVYNDEVENELLEQLIKEVL